MEENKYYKDWLRRTYAHQRSHSKERGHDMPNYSKSVLSKWVLGQGNSKLIFENWVASGFEKWKRPSIDRKDDSLPYLLSNIQLMTWYENNLKAHNTHNRSVLQFDLEGNFIEEFNSIKQAKRKTGATGVSKCCNNKQKTSGGYKWSFKETSAFKQHRV